MFSWIQLIRGKQGVRHSTSGNYCVVSLGSASQNRIIRDTPRKLSSRNHSPARELLIESRINQRAV